MSSNIEVLGRKYREGGDGGGQRNIGGDAATAHQWPSPDLQLIASHHCPKYSRQHKPRQGIVAHQVFYCIVLPHHLAHHILPPLASQRPNECGTGPHPSGFYGTEKTDLQEDARSISVPRLVC